MAMRAVRGATRVEVDEREHVLERTYELVDQVMKANALVVDDVVSVIFTATHDISSVAPALAARHWGMVDAALICAQELYVEGYLTRVVRLLAHVETEQPQSGVQNVYLHGTEVLRADSTGGGGTDGE